METIQRRLAWPQRKDDTQNREPFHIKWAHHPPHYLIQLLFFTQGPIGDTSLTWQSNNRKVDVTPGPP